jgi:hypothetical protein
MSRSATRAIAALLCGVVLVALGLAITAMPDTERAPESISVEIAFDPFLPGRTQTRTSSVDVPVPSQVTEARIDTAGAPLDIELTICQLDRCREIVAGTELDPGPYTLTIAATLDEDVAPGSSTDIAGEIRIVETRRPTAIDTTLLTSVAGIGVAAVAIGALLVRQRQEVGR